MSKEFHSTHITDVEDLMERIFTDVNIVTLES